MQTINHIPDMLQDIKEFKVITSCYDKENYELSAMVEDLYNDQFVLTSKKAIERYEDMLKITVRKSDSIDMRRIGILAIYNRKLPYTKFTLKKLINSVVKEEDFILDINSNLHTVELVILNKELKIITDLKQIIEEIIPLNMMFLIIAEYINELLLQIKTDTAFTVNTNFYPRYNAEFLTLDGTWTLNGKYSLTGYKTDSHIDFYPVGMKISTLIQNCFGTITRQSFHTDLKTRLESEVVHKFNSEHDTNVKKDSIIYIRSSTNIETKITSTLTSAKDIWKIDGSVRLGEGRIIPEKIDNNIL